MNKKSFSLSLIFFLVPVLLYSHLIPIRFNLTLVFWNLASDGFHILYTGLPSILLFLFSIILGNRKYDQIIRCFLAFTVVVIVTFTLYMYNSIPIFPLLDILLFFVAIFVVSENIYPRQRFRLGWIISSLSAYLFGLNLVGKMQEQFLLFSTQNSEKALLSALQGFSLGFAFSVALILGISILMLFFLKRFPWYNHYVRIPLNLVLFVLFILNFILSFLK